VSGDSDDTQKKAAKPVLVMDMALARFELDRQIALGRNLVPSIGEPKIIAAAATRVIVWDEANRALLSRMFSDSTLMRRYASDPLWVVRDMSSNAHLLVKVISGRLKWLAKLRDGLEGYAQASATASRDTAASEQSECARVFIIHGHDRTAALELQRLVEKKTDLDVVLMDQQPHGGRTLVEKFEQEAADCGYAIAVFTPDDVVAKDDEEYAQMRPNVVFELGWFVGRIGRERTCILYKEPTEVPSDLQGIGYYPFHGSVEEAWVRIDGELREAGLID